MRQPVDGCTQPSRAREMWGDFQRNLTVCFLVFLLLLPAGLLNEANAVNPTPARAGDWSDTIALTTLGYTLYTIEKNGALYRTDLTSGKWVQLGKQEFTNTAFLFADNKGLYTIEQDGSLYRINPITAAWGRMGEPGDWKDTIALAVLDNSLYSIESSGFLYRTDLSSGRWAELGKADFARTQFMFAAGQNLYTIESDGSMYQVSPKTGVWMGVGRSGDWKDTIAGTTIGLRIYTVESNGVLYETNPTEGGVWRQIGKADFAGSQFLLAAGGQLYSIENGDLYRINPATGSWAPVGQ